jgi:nucleoside-diphosphate-sugar epimerase
VVGGVYNIGGGSRQSLAGALELIAELAGRELDVHHVPHQEGDVRDTAADIERARANLGYEPATGFREGLELEFEWARSTLAPASG